MDDKRKEEILDSENALRAFMMEKRDMAERILSEDAWQGLMVTLALDVATSGLPQEEALSTLLGMGFIAGYYYDDAAFRNIIDEFPNAIDIRDFWMDKVEQIVKDATEEIVSRPGEEQ